MRQQMLVGGTAVAVLCSLPSAAGVDNGLGLTPPMGWRHWKAFYAHIDQTIMEQMQDEMVRKHPVDGVPTSLRELGYAYVGLDDHWQNCTTICPNGTVVPSWKPYGNPGHLDYNYQCCHDAEGKCIKGSTVLPWYEQDGTPLVDKHRFPSLKDMVARGHSKGVRSGWYFGNYQCMGGVYGKPWNMTALVEGSVKMAVDYGFDSMKIDSGFSVGHNMSLWSATLNASGRPVMLENCHQGGEGPGMNDSNANYCTGLTTPSDCPYNFWRTTGDPYPSWGSIMGALNSLRHVTNPSYGPGKRAGSPEYNSFPPRSRPGGWAYANTMTVGDGSLTLDENRVHFGGWCIISSPLILAFNLSDSTRREFVWDIITNKEAIQVNQIWDGHPGRQVVESAGSNGEVEVWVKPVGEGRKAVFVINTANSLNTDPTKPVLGLDMCVDGDEGQLWDLVKGENGVVEIKTVSGENCLEIHACSTSDHAGVDANFGCKKLPPPGTTGCGLNMAFQVNSNHTITSLLGGRCLAPQKGGSGLEVTTCDGNATQQWELQETAKGTIIREAAGRRRCVAYEPPQNVTITLDLEALNITGTVKVRDVWAKADLPDATGTLKTQLPHHGSQFFVFSPKNAAWPIPYTVAPWLRP